METIMRKRSKIKSQGLNDRGASVSPSERESRMRLDEDGWGACVDRRGLTCQQRSPQVLHRNLLLVHDPMMPSVLNACHQKSCSCHIPDTGMGRGIQDHERNVILLGVAL
jgi:hypothetical protein